MNVSIKMLSLIFNILKISKKNEKSSTQNTLQKIEEFLRSKKKNGIYQCVTSSVTPTSTTLGFPRQISGSIERRLSFVNPTSSSRVLKGGGQKIAPPPVSRVSIEIPL